MSGSNDSHLLGVILDSWDRNNRILVNLLRAIPPAGLKASALPGSPTVAQMFTHIHYVRLVFLSEDAPDLLSIPVPPREWLNETDVDRLTAELDRSAAAVRNAVQSLLESGQPTLRHFDHPLLYLQHMIWHEGYHHGQIKLALKAIGQPLENKQIGPLTWGIFINKSKSNSS